MSIKDLPKLAIGVIAGYLTHLDHLSAWRGAVVGLSIYILWYFRHDQRAR